MLIRQYLIIMLPTILALGSYRSVAAQCCIEGDCGTIWYVDQDAVGGDDDGSKWENAFLNLEDAIAAVSTLAYNKSRRSSELNY